MQTTFNTLPRLRSHYASLAAGHRWNADRAEDKGLTILAAKDRAAAEAAQAKANAITVTMRAQHMSAPVSAALWSL